MCFQHEIVVIRSRKVYLPLDFFFPMTSACAFFLLAFFPSSFVCFIRYKQTSSNDPFGDLRLTASPHSLLLSSKAVSFFPPVTLNKTKCEDGQDEDKQEKGTEEGEKTQMADVLPLLLSFFPRLAMGCHFPKPAEVVCCTRAKIFFSVCLSSKKKKFLLLFLNRDDLLF